MNTRYSHAKQARNNTIGSPFPMIRLIELDQPGLLSVAIALTQPGMHITGDIVIDDDTARALGNELIAWANEQAEKRAGK